MTILIMQEGVTHTTLNKPIQEGCLLMRSLGDSGNRIVYATNGSHERAERQLRQEHLFLRVAEIIDSSVALPPYPLWQRQIELIRSRYPITLVVTSRPDVTEWLVEHGVCVLFFAHPGYSKPARRPDQGNRAWVDLVEELEGRL